MSNWKKIHDGLEKTQGGEWDIIKEFDKEKEAKYFLDKLMSEF